MPEWRGYSYDEVRSLFLAEMPEDFHQRFPPPERQALPGEKKHLPISKDVKARRSASVGAIQGPPWSNKFRALMSDDVAMQRLREMFPIRWAVAKMREYSATLGTKRRAWEDRKIQVLTMYCLGNFDVREIARMLDLPIPRVISALHAASTTVSELVGPLGRDLALYDPQRFREGVREGAEVA